MRILSKRQADARTRAIEALAHMRAAGVDEQQAAAFAEVFVDAMLDSAAFDPSDHAAAVGELMKPGEHDHGRN